MWLPNILWGGIFLCVGSVIYTQPAEYRFTPGEYIEKYKDLAILKMQQYKIPASITLAQGMLESDNGNSTLARYANNHFGIKCHTDWKGDFYIQDDDRKNECFRKYKSVEESYEDHAKFLTTRGRYAFLFELKPTDYKGWAEGLQEAGYATNKRYAALLIKIIEDYRLYQYDRMAVLSTANKPKTLVSAQQQVVKPSFSSQRKILLNNRIKCVIAQEGDTYYKIAQELGMRLWQLHHYNEAGKQHCLEAGDFVYLQPKRRRSYTEEIHVVRLGDTMHEISQLYGIKMKHLYRMNGMKEGEEPQPGQQILLRPKRKSLLGRGEIKNLVATKK